MDNDIETKLFNAMDTAAMHLIRVLEDETTTGEGDEKRPTIDLKTKMACFDKAQEWLTKRPKMRPGASSSETEGIDRLRDMMADPVQMVDRLLADPACVTELKGRDWLPPPPRKPGRPTIAESAHKAQAKARRKGAPEMRPDDDDSKLSKMVGN